MQDFEKLGVFYLGREVDPETLQRKQELVLYDSRDLVTHAVCVGMTGSGKTGLCMCLLEEAALDGIPSLIIDPKGDLSNLLLTFPELQTQDFLPWIQQEDAQRNGLSPEEYAATKAESWRKGLNEWGQDGARIKRLKESAEFRIYTPGSTAGIPVSILNTFARPDEKILADRELVRERITNTVTSVLGLLGMEANPIQSREHILLSTILDSAWKQGIDLDLPGLIQQIQTPSFQRVGVFDLESFFPSKDRLAFAMSLNHLLAAPGFDVWMQGEPLDIARLLYTPEAKPRACIFSISHLSDAERMFFVSMLLSQIVGWMRMQSGTGSLRAIVYMDEIFGYFPPVANPPSKEPLLTLLKQARAFGIGIVLATQNPVDLDYKGLANTGTWMIGRLQTERDKERLLDGLEGLGNHAGFDRPKMDSILSRLKTRIFVMNNIHEENPLLFESRWALSYLAGPLTRNQIKLLMQNKQPDLKAPVPPAADVSTPSPATTAGSERPVLPPQVPQCFFPIRVAAPTESELVYIPHLYGYSKLYFADAKAGLATQEEMGFIAEFSTQGSPWERAKEVLLRPEEMDRFPEEEAHFLAPNAIAAQSKSYSVWNKALVEYIYRNKNLTLLKSQSLSQFSRPSESERDFRIRLQQVFHENRDKQVEKLRQKYAAKIQSLQERIRRSQSAVEREKEQADQQKMQTAISFGATVLGALFSRKKIGTSTVGRATTAARGVGRTMKESQDIERAQANVNALQQQLAQIEQQLQTEIDTLMQSNDPLTEVLNTIEVRARKSNISVEMVALAWVPYWKDPSGKMIQAWNPLLATRA